MFGYIVLNKPECKIRDFETYQSFYCGLCRSLKRRHGVISQLTLTYDMTFLSLLLTSLYEDKRTRIRARCPTRPWRKMPKVTGRYSDYAADMNLLLAWYNLKDDWKDDRKISALLLSSALRGRVRRIEKTYPRQSKAVKTYIRDLTLCEHSKSPDPDEASGMTGRMLGEIFVFREDEWADTLRRLGFYLGKFIYLMDAFEDLERDQQSGSYNPLLHLPPGENFTEDCRQILISMMAECAKAFERLPIVDGADILRNILYSGVWSRFEQLTHPSAPENKCPGHCRRRDCGSHLNETPKGGTSNS